MSPRTTPNATTNRPAGRSRLPRPGDSGERVSNPVSPAANSGASGSGANFVATERPSITARQTGEANSTSAQTSSAATSASFEFD